MKDIVRFSKRRAGSVTFVGDSMATFGDPRTIRGVAD
jgi:hypothetical protein